MDIRFIAIIFVVAAIMEMLAKLARKRRGEELDDGSGPGSADPLAHVLREMRLTPDDDELPEQARPRLEAGMEVRATSAVEGGPDTVEPRRGGVVEPWEMAPPPSRAGQVAETPPPVPVPAPEVVPGRDRAPRPIEVRSREFRSREAREFVPRETGALPVPVVVPSRPKEGVPREAGTRRRSKGAGESGVPGLGSVRGLRRLVVAREVLGPPLALRGEDPFKDQ